VKTTPQGRVTRTREREREYLHQKVSCGRRGERLMAGLRERDRQQVRQRGRARLKGGRTIAGGLARAWRQADTLICCTPTLCWSQQDESAVRAEQLAERAGRAELVGRHGAADAAHLCTKREARRTTTRCARRDCCGGDFRSKRDGRAPTLRRSCWCGCYCRREACRARAKWTSCERCCLAACELGCCGCGEQGESESSARTCGEGDGAMAAPRADAADAG
jgi:hypothetical protein